MKTKKETIKTKIEENLDFKPYFKYEDIRFILWFIIGIILYSTIYEIFSFLPNVYRIFVTIITFLISLVLLIKIQDIIINLKIKSR